MKTKIMTTNKKCPSCKAENSFKNGICPDCNFSTINKNDLRCPICAGRIEIRGPFYSFYTIYAPYCLSNKCTEKVESGIWNKYKNSKEEMLEAWIELCKKI